MFISTVIPVYNDGAHLRRCLQSICSAVPGPHEVIVVDDGSTQDISAVVREFPLARVIRQKTRMGPGYARYVGAKASGGDVIAFLDSDCTIKPEWFKIIDIHLHKDAGGITGGYIPCNIDHFVAFYEAVDIGACYSYKKSDTVTETKVVIGGCCAFWKHALLDINFKPSFVFGGLAAGEDTLLGLAMGRKFKLLRVEDMKVYHHFHETWRQYFRKRFIDGWSHTVIRLLYKRDFKKLAYLRYPYIVLHLATTAFLVYGLMTRAYFVVLLVFFALLYSEAVLLRKIFSRIKSHGKRKLEFVLIRLPCVLIRNACWLAGVTSGIVYYLINHDRLLRLTISEESDNPA